LNPAPIPRQQLFDRLRRSFTRYRFSVEAELVLTSRKVWGRVEDISRGGMFIETDHPFRLDQTFCAYLALDTPLALYCKVRRVVEGCGIGVTLSVTSAAKARFEALLLALAAGADPASAAAKPHETPERLSKAASAGSKHGGAR
jgi:PilZ domain-containing protein